MKQSAQIRKSMNKANKVSLRNKKSYNYEYANSNWYTKDSLLRCGTRSREKIDSELKLCATKQKSLLNNHAKTT